MEPKPEHVVSPKCQRRVGKRYENATLQHAFVESHLGFKLETACLSYCIVGQCNNWEECRWMHREQLCLIRKIQGGNVDNKQELLCMQAMVDYFMTQFGVNHHSTDVELINTLNGFLNQSDKHEQLILLILFSGVICAVYNEIDRSRELFTIAKNYAQVPFTVSLCNFEFARCCIEYFSGDKAEIATFWTKCSEMYNAAINIDKCNMYFKYHLLVDESKFGDTGKALLLGCEVVMMNCAPDRKLKWTIEAAKKIVSKCGMPNYYKDYWYSVFIDCLELIRRAAKNDHQLRNSARDMQNFIRRNEMHKKNATVQGSFEMCKQMAPITVCNNYKVTGVCNCGNNPSCFDLFQNLPVLAVFDPNYAVEFAEHLVINNRNDYHIDNELLGQLYLTMGDALWCLDNYYLAEGAYSAAIVKHHTKSVFAYWRLGQILMNLEQYQQAHEYFDLALKEKSIDNDFKVKLLVQHGCCLLKLDEKDAAVVKFKEALKLNPAREEAFKHLLSTQHYHNYVLYDLMKHHPKLVLTCTLHEQPQVKADTTVPPLSVDELKSDRDSVDLRSSYEISIDNYSLPMYGNNNGNNNVNNNGDNNGDNNGNNIGNNRYSPRPTRRKTRRQKAEEQKNHDENLKLGMRHWQNGQNSVRGQYGSDKNLVTVTDTNNAESRDQVSISTLPSLSTSAQSIQAYRKRMLSFDFESKRAHRNRNDASSSQSTMNAECNSESQKDGYKNDRYKDDVRNDRYKNDVRNDRYKDDVRNDRYKNDVISFSTTTHVSVISQERQNDDCATVASSKNVTIASFQAYMERARERFG